MNGKLLLNKGRKQLFIILLVLTASFSLQAQDFFKTFAARPYGEPRRAILTADSGIAITGLGLFSLPGTLPSVIKVDSYADSVWEKTIDTPEMSTMSGTGFSRCMVATDDGGVLYFDLANYLVRLDNAGNVLWSKRLILPDPFYNIELTKLGSGYAFLAVSDNNKVIIGALDANGDLLSASSFAENDMVLDHGQAGDFIEAIDNDNLLIILKRRNANYTLISQVIMSYNITNGTANWIKEFSSSNGLFANFNSNTITSDNKIILTGCIADTLHTDGDTDLVNQALVVKMDLAGNVLWSKQFGTYDKETGVACIEISGNRYIVAGQVTYSQNWNADINNFALELDENGNMLSHRRFGGESRDILVSILNAADDNFYLVGITTSYLCQGKIFVARFNTTSTSCWDIPSEGSLSNAVLNESTLITTLSPHSGVTCPSVTTLASDNSIGQIIDLCPLSCATLGIEEGVTTEEITVYPNPAQSSISFRGELGDNTAYVIYNTLGQAILLGRFSKDQKIIDIASLPAGMYTVSVQNGAQISVQKFIKE